MEVKGRVLMGVRTMHINSPFNSTINNNNISNKDIVMVQATEEQAHNISYINSNSSTRTIRGSKYILLARMVLIGEWAAKVVGQCNLINTSLTNNSANITIPSHFRGHPLVRTMGLYLLHHHHLQIVVHHTVLHQGVRHKQLDSALVVEAVVGMQRHHNTKINTVCNNSKVDMHHQE